MRRLLYLAVLSAVAVLVLAPTARAQTDVDCSTDFQYQEDAQAVLDQDLSDPNGLDEDDDGIACETLPSRALEDTTGVETTTEDTTGVSDDQDTTTEETVAAETTTEDATGEETTTGEETATEETTTGETAGEETTTEETIVGGGTTGEEKTRRERRERRERTGDETTGANGEVTGPNGEVTGPNGEVTGANGEVTGPNGEVAGANGEVTGPNGEVTGPNGEVVAGPKGGGGSQGGLALAVSDGLGNVARGRLPNTGGGWAVLLVAGAVLIGGGWLLVRRFSST